MEQATAQVKEFLELPADYDPDHVDFVDPELAAENLENLSDQYGDDIVSLIDDDVTIDLGGDGPGDGPEEKLLGADLTKLHFDQELHNHTLKLHSEFDRISQMHTASDTAITRLGTDLKTLANSSEATILKEFKHADRLAKGAAFFEALNTVIGVYTLLQSLGLFHHSDDTTSQATQAIVSQVQQQGILTRFQDNSKSLQTIENRIDAVLAALESNSLVRGPRQEVFGDDVTLRAMPADYATLLLGGSSSQGMLKQYEYHTSNPAVGVSASEFFRVAGSLEGTVNELKASLPQLPRANWVWDGAGRRFYYNKVLGPARYDDAVAQAAAMSDQNYAFRLATFDELNQTFGGADRTGWQADHGFDFGSGFAATSTIKTVSGSGGGTSYVAEFNFRTGKEQVGPKPTGFGQQDHWYDQKLPYMLVVEPKVKTREYYRFTQAPDKISILPGISSDGVSKEVSGLSAWGLYDGKWIELSDLVNWSSNSEQVRVCQSLSSAGMLGADSKARQLRPGSLLWGPNASTVTPPTIQAAFRNNLLLGGQTTNTAFTPGQGTQVAQAAGASAIASTWLSLKKPPYRTGVQVFPPVLEITAGAGANFVVQEAQQSVVDDTQNGSLPTFGSATNFLLDPGAQLVQTSQIMAHGIPLVTAGTASEQVKFEPSDSALVVQRRPDGSYNISANSLLEGGSRTGTLTVSLPGVDGTAVHQVSVLLEGSFPANPGGTGSTTAVAVAPFYPPPLKAILIDGPDVDMIGQERRELSVIGVDNNNRLHFLDSYPGTKSLIRWQIRQLGARPGQTESRDISATGVISEQTPKGYTFWQVTATYTNPYDFTTMTTPGYLYDHSPDL